MIPHKGYGVDRCEVVIVLLGYLAAGGILGNNIVVGEADKKSIVVMRVDIHNLRQTAIVGDHNFPLSRYFKSLHNG